MTKKRVESGMQYRDVYVAIDGTEFFEECECVEYEHSAKCALKYRLTKTAMSDMSEDEMLGAGIEDNRAFGVFPTAENVLMLQHLSYLINGNDEYAEKAAATIEANIGRPVIIVIGDDDCGLWASSLDEIVRNATGGLWKLVENK